MKFQNLQNYATEENGCRIVEATSENINGAASNVLHTNRHNLWITVGPPPQSLTIDISSLEQKPKESFNLFGIDCWYDFETNPNEIEISYSKDGKRFELAGKFSCRRKQSWQFFNLKEISCKANYLRLTILSNFGDEATTYVNQIFLSSHPPEISEIDRYLPTNLKSHHAEREINSLKQRVEQLERDNQKINNTNKILNNKVTQMQEKIEYLLAHYQEKQAGSREGRRTKVRNRSSSSESLEEDAPRRGRDKQHRGGLPPAPKMSSGKHALYKKSGNNSPSSSSGVSNYQINFSSTEKNQQKQRQGQKQRIQKLKKQLELKKRHKESVEKKMELSNDRKRTSSDYGHY